MIYELTLLDDPIEAAKAEVRSAIGKLNIATIELAVLNLKKSTEPPGAREWAQFLKAVRENLTAAVKADKERADKILDDLDARSKARDEALSGFDAVSPAGRSLQ